MARIRSIKPEFFRHELLQDLEIRHPGKYCMLVFAGLWGHCDRSGTFEWKPRQLKLDVLPFLDFNMDETLGLLRDAGLVKFWETPGKQWGNIRTFPEHQRITGKEAVQPLRFPQVPENVEGHNSETLEEQRGNTGETPGCVTDVQEGKGKGRGREGNGSAREGAPTDPGEAWREVGADPGAMTAWIDHREINKPPGLAPHERVAAAKLLAGMGPPEIQRAAVQLAVANGWRNLRPSDAQPSHRGPTKADRESADREQLERLKASRAERGVPDFREPHEHEPPDAYETALKLAARDVRPTASIAALAKSKTVVA